MARIRAGSPKDADALSAVLRAIIADTGRDRPHDRAFVLATYLANPANVRCSVAVDGAGEVLGFQSLIRAVPGNRFDVPVDWGIIGTHIHPGAHRQGIGGALFAASRAAAQAAGIERIDACIGANTPVALAYYARMGFVEYRRTDAVVHKMVVIPPAGR